MSLPASRSFSQESPSDWEFSTVCRSRSNFRRALKSSITLVSHTDQVTTEAKARPIITAFTILSAAMNMPIGVRSCGSTGSASAALAGASSVTGGED